MSPFSVRALIACTSLACASVLGSKADAELPRHESVRWFGPDNADMEIESPMRFGHAVALRNGLAFFGMPAYRFGNGAVRVFAQTPTGWVKTATLTANDSAPVQLFGRSLTFRDNILVVGARQAAYVFQLVDGVWKQRQKLVAPAADNVLSFADALRYEEGALAVGAEASDRAGAVYVFVRDAAGKFVRRARLRPAESSPQDTFGVDISMAGPAMVIGAPGAAEGAGAAYVFRRSSTGVWRQQQKLVAAETRRGDHFGAAVAIDRAMIIVGAPRVGDDGLDRRRTGAAYGFVPSGSVFVETFKLQPREDEHSEYRGFGYRVAMFGERVAVSAFEGAVVGDVAHTELIFTYTRENWSVTPRGLAIQPIGTNYQASIALFNNLLLVGYPCDYESFCTGRAELFHLNRYDQE